jgi:hypothetical protein
MRQKLPILDVPISDTPEHALSMHGVACNSHFYQTGGE